MNRSVSLSVAILWLGALAGCDGDATKEPDGKREMKKPEVHEPRNITEVEIHIGGRLSEVKGHEWLKKEDGNYSDDSGIIYQIPIKVVFPHHQDYSVLSLGAWFVQKEGRVVRIMVSPSFAPKSFPKSFQEAQALAHQELERLGFPPSAGIRQAVSKWVESFHKDAQEVERGPLLEASDSLDPETSISIVIHPKVANEHPVSLVFKLKGMTEP